MSTNLVSHSFGARGSEHQAGSRDFHGGLGNFGPLAAKLRHCQPLVSAANNGNI